MTARNWSEASATGVRAIDSTNECLAFVLEELFLGPRACPAETASCPKIEDVERFLERKFRREEKLMEEFGFPGLSAHRIQHISFLRQIHVIRKDVVCGAYDPAAMHNVLTEWIVDHVNLFDAEFGRFLALQRGDADDARKYSMFS